MTAPQGNHRSIIIYIVCSPSLIDDGGGLIGITHSDFLIIIELIFNAQSRTKSIFELIAFIAMIIQIHRPNVIDQVAGKQPFLLKYVLPL